MSTIPPLTNPRAYATHLLADWYRQLLHRQRGPDNHLLPVLKKELARRREHLAAIPPTT